MTAHFSLIGTVSVRHLGHVTIYWPQVQFNITRYYQHVTIIMNRRLKDTQPTINYTIPTSSSSMCGAYFHATISTSRQCAAFTSGKSNNANSTLLSCYLGRYYILYARKQSIHIATVQTMMPTFLL